MWEACREVSGVPCGAATIVCCSWCAHMWLGVVWGLNWLERTYTCPGRLSHVTFRVRVRVRAGIALSNRRL